MSNYVSRIVPNASEEKLHIKHYWCGTHYYEYNYRCGWCGALTDSDYVAYTDEGPVDHLCWKCRYQYQMYDKLSDSRRYRKRK